MRAVHVALVAIVTASLAAPSASAGRVKPPKVTRPPSITTSTAVDIRSVHNNVCPQVVEYASCSSITVTVAAYGLTGWTARSGPAAGTVEYNSSYTMTASGWAQTVSHEVGGHHDAWAELVARVGVSQAWLDWPDLGRFGEPWAEGRFAAIGAPRDLSLTEGKEIYLDCAGPVAHGYPGNYLTNRGVTDQPLFCRGYETVMSNAAG